MPDKPLILVADDEEDVRELVCLNLEQAGFATTEAATGLEAIDRAKKRLPAAIVLDVMMPGRDGFRTCEALRQDPVTTRIPILMLTARGQTQDRIAGLQKGADDYMAKPFSPKELVLRVQGLLRRADPGPAQPGFKIGPFEFDLANVKLSVLGEIMPLTLLEFKLLHLLATKNGAVVDRETILREVWGYSDQARTRTLDTHMKRLREKLGGCAEWLQTARGYGYMLKEPPAS
ncbi:MAG: response regulator transcription factor [Verrucomicrobiaceae bacterium]|nr:response regulator transcription factor [Verrucomicrobiaceae bacterium]